MKRFVPLLGLIVAMTPTAPRAFAHETDQFTVPVGRQFADLRFWFSEYMYDKLEAALNKSNARIRSTLREGPPTPATAKAQSLDTLAWNVLLEFPPVINYIELLEGQLAGANIRSRYPGLLVTYLPPQWIYHHPFLVLDPTKLPRLRRSSTMMVNGTYFGTDKVAHFIHMGYLYFRTYRTSLAAGNSIEEAVKKAVNEGAGSGIFSENGLLGFIPTGVISNGDKVADYVGMKFYLNLTEPVTLKGTTQPPLFVRDGELYRFNDHVRRDTDFFNVFISDHWNEALNPNTYGPGQETWIREEVLKRCDDIIAWYLDDSGRPMKQADFRRIAADLATYYGEDYGHAGDLDVMVSIYSTCFESGSATQSRGNQLSSTTILDSLGRTPLWRASRAGNKGEVAASWNTIDANRADIDGETPLHAAVRADHVEITRILLAGGASANVANRHGATPLHLAAQQDTAGVARELLAAGANTNAKDEFGCTPLHDASRRGSPQVAELLLASGADPRVADRFGTTPLHRAARAGNLETVRLLLKSGANADAMNSMGVTPVDEARNYSGRDAKLLEQIMQEARHARHRPHKNRVPLVEFPDSAR